MLSLWKAVIHPPPRLRDILAETANAFGLSVGDLRGKSRCRSIAWIRQAYCYEAYSYGRWSMPQIGRTINRDHTTVLHSVRAYSRRNGLPALLGADKMLVVCNSKSLVSGTVDCSNFPT